MKPEYWSYVWRFHGFPYDGPSQFLMRCRIAGKSGRRGVSLVEFETGLVRLVPNCGLRRMGAGKQLEFSTLEES
jgi:hypothetical protein